MTLTLIPRSFLGISLQVGAEIVAACCIINKISSFYGLGALFTGHKLTVMQWITNLLAFSVVPLTVWGYFGILNRKPLRSLVFTHFYILDTFVSLGFTIHFIIYWFTVAGRSSNNIPQGYKGTNSTDLVSRQLVAGGNRLASNQSEIATLDKSMTVGQELAMTITATTVFLLVRFYFMLVLVGYSRLVVRKANLKPKGGYPANSVAAWVQYLLLSTFETFWTGASSSRARSRSFGPAETQRLRSVY